MKNYEKPVLEETKIVIEGVFAGSGEKESENDGNNGTFGECEKNGVGNRYKFNGSCKKCSLYNEAVSIGKCPLA